MDPLGDLRVALGPGATHGAHGKSIGTKRNYKPREPTRAPGTTWVLGNLMAVLGASWGILGASWGVFGVFWAVLGGSWGASWGCSFTVPIETYYWGALLGYFLNLV